MTNFQIKENLTKMHSGIVKQNKTFVAKEILWNLENHQYILKC